MYLEATPASAPALDEDAYALNFTTEASPGFPSPLIKSRFPLLVTMEFLLVAAIRLLLIMSMLVDFPMDKLLAAAMVRLCR